MPELLSERAYAKHRGCARSSIQAARRRGRLSRAVSTDENGRVWIDPEVADREWAASTYADRAPLTGRTAPRRRSSAGGGPKPAELAALEQRLAAVVKADLAEAERFILERLVPELVEGALEELRRAGGGSTAADVATALRLDLDDEDSCIEASTSLCEIVFSATADPAADARAAGREIASGRWWQRQEGER